VTLGRNPLSRVDRFACEPPPRLARAARYPLLRLRKCSLYARSRKRDSSQPNPHPIENGIGQGRSHGSAGRFTGAEVGLLRPVGQLHVKRWRFGKSQQGIAGPIRAGNARLIESHLLVKRPAEGGRR
jgi:hypothetical protein